MDKQEYIQYSTDKMFKTWLRSAVTAGALTFLLLSFLDFVVFRDHFARFLVYRVAVASFLFLIAVLAGKTVNRAALQFLAFTAVMASAVAIEVMILQTGGYASPYGTGMILLAVIALAFVPAESFFHAATAAAMYGIYLLPIIMTERIDNMPAFFTMNFFMCSIILAVVVFRHLSTQSVRKQLGAEYELIASADMLRENEAQLEEMIAARTSDLEIIIEHLETEVNERKRADEALRESEGRFRTLLDNAPIAISIVNMDGTVEYVNRKHPEIMGYDLQDIPTLEHWWSSAYPDEPDRTRIRTAWYDLTHRVLKGEKIAAVNRKVVCKDGTIKELELSFRAAADKIIVAFGDITDRKRAEGELQEKEEKMRAMLESFDGFIYICSPDYRVEFMNENLIRRTGRNAVGEYCFTALNDRASVCPWCVNERVFRGEIIRYEIQSQKDGRWYHIVNTPIRHSDGSVSKQAMILDVTERKKSDIALMESEDRYKRLLASVTDYIYTVDVKDGRPVATEHGEGSLAVTGYSPKQFLEDPDLWYRMIYDADSYYVLEQTNKMFAGEKTAPLEHRIVHRDGSIRWVRNTLVPRFDKFRKLMAVDGLISDITEKKMLEEKLEKARAIEEENIKMFFRLIIDVQEDERRAIARELHDEIGQSLTGLKLSVESIADSLPSELADNLRPIEISLGELLSFVRNLSLNLRPAMLDDFGLVSTLLWYFDRYKSRTGISVEFSRTGKDRRFGPQKEIALYRITQEALTNVARYAEVQSVLVELTIDRDRVALGIRDEGNGFDIETMLHFSSGLSIMRERSLLLKGTFSLASSPGKGTEVTVAFPLDEMADEHGGRI